jgi:hypothetical protein
MSRQSVALLLLATCLGLSACTTSDDEATTAAKKAAAAEAAAPLVAPTTTDDKLWKPYLAKVISQHTAGVTDRQIPYYLPADNATVEADGKSKYDRLSEAVTDAISRTVLPGNQLAFGSPDSKRMGDLILSAFSGAKPNAMKGSQVLFIGKAEDSARIKGPVEASGATYIFVEAK